MYYLGIDGSGNFSRIIGVDETAKVIGRHTGNATNISESSVSDVSVNLSRLVSEFNKLTNTSIPDCKALCIGSAGIGSEATVSAMEGILRSLGFICPLAVVNDAELVLAAETAGNPGVAVIAGSGSIAIALDKNGILRRSGGNGHILDDFGSLYWIGLQAIRQALMAEDGRSDITVLTKSVLEHFKIQNIYGINDIVYSEKYSKQRIAELALLVKYAAQQKDEAAISIEEAASNELFRLANALLTKYQLESTVVVLSGSVLLLNESIQERVKELLSERFSKLYITPAKGKPEMGAVYLAMKLT